MVNQSSLEIWELRFSSKGGLGSKIIVKGLLNLDLAPNIILRPTLEPKFLALERVVRRRLSKEPRKFMSLSFKVPEHIYE
ncbi:hypothetical protein CEXT_729541 [Caerostris extrusa]|uniref:Uncharacterized protein n=1 Tax=Caerostris extrusa TaxID=172846 RepID=A0AAV4WQB5_CAEEX|nr:hypothetical protein CEXT_729541 [Caerostris extrusa]